MPHTALSTSALRALPATAVWLVLSVLGASAPFLDGGSALAQSTSRQRVDDAYRPPSGSGSSLGTLPAPIENPANGQTGGGTTYQSGGYNQPTAGYGEPLPNTGGYGRNESYRPPDGYQSGGYQGGGYQGGGRTYDPGYGSGPSYGRPYSSPGDGGGYASDDRGPPRGRGGDYADAPSDKSYSRGEILDAGGRFFGAISKGLASAIEYTYQQAGRPNGYILGEDAGGAFFGGLRYGEGVLYTKDAGTHKVYWQGPSLGYDVGGEGSKVMVLVYDLAEPGELYQRFGGVEGSAYVVGGVSVQFQKNDNVTLAVIRSGVGLRLGANVGYTKYTRRPTWNPF